MLEERKRDPALAGLSNIGAGGESGISPRICLARLIPNSSPPTFEAGIKPKVSQRHASLSKPSRAISNLSRPSSSRKAANDRMQFCTASSLRPCASLHAALKAHPSTLSSTYVCVHTAFAASGLSSATRRRDSPQQLSSCITGSLDPEKESFKASPRALPLFRPNSSAFSQSPRIAW